MLLLQVGCAHYGLDAELIGEVVEGPSRYSVPQSGAFLLGVINLHGEVLPVIDLPELLGVTAAPRDQRLVVLSPAFHRLALATTGVGRMVSFEAAELRQPTADERMKAIAGVVASGELGAAVNLLDADAVVERLKTFYPA
jgi:purine-binding chemotaxis protein CheW